MVVDMDRRKLGFSANGETRTDAGVRISRAVRPWVRIGLAGDAVATQSVMWRRTAGGGGRGRR
eukprot:4359544-Prymnesium_polylepis.2